MSRFASAMCELSPIGSSPIRSVGRMIVAVVAVCLTLTPVRANAAEMRYVTRFHGIGDSRLLGLVKEVSSLRASEKRHVANEVALERRAMLDIKRIREVLESESYYDALVTYDIQPEQKPVVLDVNIDLGPRYLVSTVAVNVLGVGSEDAAIRAHIERLSRLETMPAKASVILVAEAELLKSVFAEGYPFAAITARSFVVDHADTSMQVALTLETGAPATFGEVRLDGLEHVESGYVRNRLPWREGDRYDPSAVEQGRRQLNGTGLFSSVRVERASAAKPDGSLPIQVSVEEAPFRTVGFGVRYDSTLGAGGGASWEHRNVLGGGERFRVSGDVSQSGWSSGLVWREPDFLRPDMTLSYSLNYEEEDTIAYDLRRAAAQVGIATPLSDTLSGAAGVSLEWTPVETKARDTATGEREQDESFLLLGFPMSLVRSTTESLLEPREGSRIELSATPYVDLSGKDLSFLVTRVTPTIYIPVAIPRFERSVLAGRVSLGSIGGAKRGDVPADKRFYGGGGGSIRGYEYQRVGELDDDDEPLGGRSLFEVGTELRLRISETFGIVGFFEGGNVYRSLYPDFDDVIRWGTGGGLRYYSPVGPLRLDIGTPVNGRGSVDDPVQFYISLGEAF